MLQPYIEKVKREAQDKFLHSIYCSQKKSKEPCRCGVDDILSLLTSSLKTYNDMVVEIIEGMKKSECICHSGGGRNVCCEECKESLFCGYNFALEDLKAKLKWLFYQLQFCGFSGS